MSEKYIPYSTQTISQNDIDAVVKTLQSGWLTGGSTVAKFEKSMAKYCGVNFGIAVSNGTAALHAAVRAIEVKQGDEIILPTISFVATANAVLYEKGTPVFSDVDPNTLLLDPDLLESLITPETRAVITVDYGGQLSNYGEISSICKKHNLKLIADGCHSLGASHEETKSGSFADLTTFSFHPVKQITTGEGGMVMTDHVEYYEHIQNFRNHGIALDPQKRHEQTLYEYEINELGWNYRLTDIQCSLGLSQMQNLDSWISTRRQIASLYDSAFANHPDIVPLTCHNVKGHAYHLYVIKVPQRKRIFQLMRNKNIGVNVHYPPIHLHNYYRSLLATYEGQCPVAEKAYQSILSIPIYPGLTKQDQLYVIDSLTEIVGSL